MSTLLGEALFAIAYFPKIAIAKKASYIAHKF